MNLIPSGYFQTFKPVIQAVMEFYQPTCIVLQVMKYFATFYMFNGFMVYDKLALLQTCIIDL